MNYHRSYHHAMMSFFMFLSSSLDFWLAYCELYSLFALDMKKGAASCNTCMHPTYNHSQNSLGVSNCVECDSGILVWIHLPLDTLLQLLRCHWHIILKLQHFMQKSSYRCLCTNIGQPKLNFRGVKSRALPSYQNWHLGIFLPKEEPKCDFLAAGKVTPSW